MRKTFIFLSLILVFAGAFTFYEYVKFYDDRLHVVFCDVGQGDAVFITTPVGTQILIDGGPDKSVLECLGKNMPFWDRSIDVVILTHPHADHFAGLIDVIDRYEIGGFYTEKEKSSSDSFKLLASKLASANLSAKDLSVGDNFSDKSGMSLVVLWPRLAKIRELALNSSNPDLNGLTIIAKLTYGDFSVLLTGDANLDAMKEVLGSAGDIDILKVPHHGSKNGTNEAILRSLRPEVAVITVGENNKYNHPDNLILELFEDAGVGVLRTDVIGDIKIVSNGKNFLLENKVD